MAKPFDDQVGNGMHMHLSIVNEKGENIFNNNIVNNNILNNNILDNIIIPNDFNDEFLEKLYITYSYEYFIATSFINNNSYDEVINKEQNLEKIFNDNYLIDNLPEYLNTNYFDKLGDLIIKHIENNN